MKVAVTLSSRDYDAVLFGLDGALTRTARMHAAAWRKLFDGFLEQRATKAGTPFVPFDIETDYTRYAGGTPRYGLAAFFDFLHPYGADLLPDSARFWSSIASFNDDRGRYDLCAGDEAWELSSGTTRAFHLNDDATDRGTHRDVPGDAP